jgi:sterol 3beta-glucosyltransferase
MRIAIIASGSRGDVQPYIALGKGLVNAGHCVRFVSHNNFATLVQSHGLEFWPVDSNVQEIAQSAEMRNRVEKGNFLFLMAQMAKEAQHGALHFAEVGLAASQGMDLILGGMGGLYTGLALAEKLNLPFLQAYLVPFTPTREFASVLVSGAPAWVGAPLNRISHHLTRQVIWQGFRAADKLARKHVLGLPAVPFSGPYRSEHTRGLPILYGFSPSVIPPPADWGEEVHVTGYWYLDEANDWVPPKALTDYLESGPAPVYVGFGSMSNRNPGETADLVIQALKQSQQRAILLSGWGGLQRADLPDSVFMVDTVPHAWLFPRLSAVVHHGGAGTTAAGLRAGVPSIIVPFFGDQPFWGRRVAELGVGPAPIPRKKLTVERLAGAIQSAVNDVGMRQRAARLGSQIRAEDGIARAVEIVRQVEKRMAAGSVLPDLH